MIPQWNHLAQMVLMRSHNIHVCFHWDIRKKYLWIFLCSPFYLKLCKRACHYSCFHKLLESKKMLSKKYQYLKLYRCKYQYSNMCLFNWTIWIHQNQTDVHLAHTVMPAPCVQWACNCSSEPLMHCQELIQKRKHLFLIRAYLIKSLILFYDSVWIW